MPLAILRYIVEAFEALLQGFVTPTFALLGKLPIGYRNKRVLFWRMLYEYKKGKRPSMVICALRTLGALPGVPVAFVLRAIVSFLNQPTPLGWQSEIGG